MTVPAQSAHDHTVWKSIDYQPVIADLLPDRLLPFLPPASVILDVGCNTGGVALFLAEHGHSCIGIDINPSAISVAKDRSMHNRLATSVGFENANLLDFNPSDHFHAVLLIRVLTCVPQVEHWRSHLDKAFALLRPGGLIYVHDFFLDPSSPIYAPRYERGRANGWRDGNFAVPNAEGALLFVAHHHSSADIAEIAFPYEPLILDHHDSFSMNGNPCRMFEFIGRKPHQ